MPGRHEAPKNTDPVIGLVVLALLVLLAVVISLAILLVRSSARPAHQEVVVQRS